LEAKIESENERKKTLDAELALREAASERKVRADLEHELATKEIKERRKRLKQARPKAPQQPNIMNRFSIHKWH